MTLDQAILATLAYHDIFDYPLTMGQIHRYLIGKKVSPKRLTAQRGRLKSTAIIGEKKGYFFLKNRRKITQTRLQRAKYSQKKQKRADFFANLLKVIPTLRLVAVSGALAMGNSRKNDDIDLVIITAKNSLWTTRFLANLILFPFKRKLPQLPTTNYKLQTNNKACLNLFLDESDLKITPQNLYTAHEICQMRPLLDRNKTYSRFIKSNSWVKKYLPNWQLSFEFIDHRSKKSQLRTMNYPLRTVEIFLKKFQLWHMRRKITTERIGEHQLFFHPSDTHRWVLAQYRKRLRKLGIEALDN